MEEEGRGMNEGTGGRKKERETGRKLREGKKDEL